MLSNIMVAVDRTNHAPERVRLATELSKKFDARLTGVGAKIVDIPLGTTDTLAYTYPDLETQAHEDVETAHGIFKRASSGSNHAEWRGRVAPPEEFLLTQSRAADIIVVGRRGPNDEFDNGFGVDPGRVVLGAGRPILVTPQHPRHEMKRVVIAWKNTREARRAVIDALPFLRHADDVTILEVTDEPRSAQGAHDVARFLEGHDIDARPLALPANGNGADAVILERATYGEVDLLVCGAYGHSRLREAMFGGVTRNLLRETEICCLVSH